MYTVQEKARFFVFLRTNNIYYVYKLFLHHECFVDGYVVWFLFISDMPLAYWHCVSWLFFLCVCVCKIHRWCYHLKWEGQLSFSYYFSLRLSNTSLLLVVVFWCFKIGFVCVTVVALKSLSSASALLIYFIIQALSHCQECLSDDTLFLSFNLIRWYLILIYTAIKVFFDCQDYNSIWLNHQSGVWCFFHWN